MNLNIPNINLPRIVIIGSGFAGLKLAKELDVSKYQIVLLDKNNYHTFQPLMYQVASASLEANSIIYPIRKAFKGKEHFHFRLLKVESVDTENNIIKTDKGVLDYDYLVIATGATTNFFGMKNIQKYGYTMKSLLESLNLRNIMIQNFETALTTADKMERKRSMNFVIVGGGASGIELAGALAELKNHVLPLDYPDLDIHKMKIHVIEASDKILPSMSTNSSKKAQFFLEDLGVNIWLNTSVKEYDGKTVTTNNVKFETYTLVWSAGVMGAPIRKIEDKLNNNNRIITDKFNKVIGLENVFALGDVSCIKEVNEGKGHSMLGSVAGQQGICLGKNLNMLAENKKMKPFKYKDKGTMATIGRHRAVVDLPFIKFSGVFAWFVWMFLHLLLLVGYRNMLVVFIDWCWNYFKYDNALRIIIGKAKRPFVPNTAKKEFSDKEVKE